MQLQSLLWTPPSQGSGLVYNVYDSLFLSSPVSDLQITVNIFVMSVKSQFSWAKTHHGNSQMYSIYSTLQLNIRFSPIEYCQDVSQSCQTRMCSCNGMHIQVTAMIESYITCNYCMSPRRWCSKHFCLFVSVPPLPNDPLWTKPCVPHLCCSQSAYGGLFSSCGLYFLHYELRIYKCTFRCHCGMA